MKRVIPCTCLAAAFAVGLSAQTPSTSAMSQLDTVGKAVTITGCLRAGTDPGSFSLANVKSSDKDKTAAASSTTTTGTTGATGTSGATTTTTTTTVNKDLENSTVKLTGSPAGVTLGDHVGHTVQVTGTLGASAPAASASAGTTGTTPPADPAATASVTTKTQPTLNVTAFTMVSGSCSM